VGKEGNRKEDASESVGDVDSRGKEKIFVDRRERRRGESSRAVEGGRRRALRCEKLGLMREANNLAPSRPAKLLHRVL
jgi:hypothetical protein